MPAHDQSCTCGCCQGTAARAPVLPENAPLLPSVSYRSGDWQTFRDTMLARLGSVEAGALTGLSTRDPQDPTIALIDAWAVTGDILSFYNERLISESLIRTAEEPDSLHQLSRLIGYQPSPGVAASADIAFTMDPAVGAPSRITLEPGTKIQSTPGPDETAVTYETIESIEARPAWNGLRPLLDQPHALHALTQKLWVEGATLAAAAGDAVLYENGATPVFALVTKVERLPANVAADPDSREFTVLHIRPLLTETLNDDTGSFISAVSAPPEPAATYLDRVIDAGDFAAEIAAAGHDEDKVFEVFESSVAAAPAITLFRARAPIFGHSAPPFANLPIALTGSVPNYEVDDGKVVANGVITGPFAGQSGQWADHELDVLDTDDEGVTYLEGTQPLLAVGTKVVLRDEDNWAVYNAEEVAEVSLSRFSISGKATMVDLSSNTAFGTLTIRGTTAYFAAETVKLARPPQTSTVIDGSSELLELHTYAPGLQKGQRIAITGRRSGDAEAVTTRMATLDEVVHDFRLGGSTAIRFSPALPEPYVRDSVRINANVAAATHGESVAELLGDGDANVPFLSVTLKQAPQTHVTDTSASGTAPTLEVRVNDIRWARVPTLLDAGPEDRVYTTTIDAEGKTTIRFGDGKTGARPPTGKQNMRARYRKEHGLKGRVRAGALNVPMSSPLGLKAAVNPLPSSGGADPESVDAIRSNAPLTVRTLDRAVSAIDYQDFAQGYAGIAKAEARLLANGVAEIVHLTVAGEDGEQVLPGAKLYDGLAGAIAGGSDPYRKVLISSYRPATFRVGARVSIDPDYLPDLVLEAVEARLRDSFGFAARRFSQSVWMSEIVAEMHQVAGVVAVDMTDLHRDFDPDGVPQPVANLHGLGAESMKLLADGTAIGAELLTLHPGPLDKLLVMT